MSGTTMQLLLLPMLPLAGTTKTTTVVAEAAPVRHHQATAAVAEAAPVRHHQTFFHRYCPQTHRQR